MVGLDLTHQALATPEVEQRVKALGTDVADFVVGLIGYWWIGAEIEIAPEIKEEDLA